MRRNIWIFNHYATDMFFDEGGRHYWLGKELIKKGYRVTIFCSNTVHKSDETIEVVSGVYEEKEKDGMHFVFVKTNPYTGNGISRIENMLAYTWNLLRLYKKYAKNNGRPDSIYASSVHPLALYAGIKVAKHFRIKSICEVRDMWPFTLIEFGRLEAKSLMARMLFRFEKWVYERADELIFTMEGGTQYIQDNSWDIANGGKIDIQKAHYINNGIDLDMFLENRSQYRIEDETLKDDSVYKVVYTGTLGQANRIDLLLDVAKHIQQKNLPIRFLIWGDGDKKEELLEKVKNESIENVEFKGKVPKKYIPFITSCSDLNISVLEDCGLYKYGLSLNKMFDYMAAQRPFIIAGAVCKCEILEQNVFCEICETSNVGDISDAICKFYEQKQSHVEIPLYDIDTLKHMCDFEQRANELVKVVEREV